MMDSVKFLLRKDLLWQLQESLDSGARTLLCSIVSFAWTMMKRWKKSFGKHVLATTNFYQIHWLLKIHFEPHYNFLWFWSFLKMMFLVSCLLAILPGQVFWDLWRVRFQVVSRWCWTLSRLDWVSGFTKRYIVTEYESPRREMFFTLGSLHLHWRLTVL